MSSSATSQGDSSSSLPSFEGSALLHACLGLALTSFLASVYSVLRTLLPLLLPHPLARRAQKGGATGEATRPLRLKSAQRFTSFLAICDILAAVILVWEAAAAATRSTGLGGETASRLTACLVARPTLLLGVASISYINVVAGKSITTGKADWIVWGPPLALLVLGAGLASLASDGPAIWIGLVVWLTLVTTIVSICFGRLLIAILRVRNTTRREEQGSSAWAQEQDRAVGRHGSKISRVIAAYLPPFHSNHSGLSTSFVHTIGRSTSTLDLSATGHDILPFSSSSAPGVGFAPSSRPSMDSDQATLRDVRSPTPGSTMGLLAGLRHSISNASARDGRATPRYSQDHEVLTFEEVDLPRPSMSSYTSTFNGGLVGGNARQAIVQEAWGSSPVPGTSSSAKVELSKKEARGAIVRIGGHLFAALLGYALITPFLFLRALRPSSSPPLFAGVLLAIGVCQPGVVLAIQCWLSEGFWYRTELPPVLTSSSAANLEIIAEGEMQKRPGSASSYYAFTKSQSTLPGISPTGEDCVETRKGRVGRAISMVQTHPKLLLLPSDSSSTSGAKPTQTHTRLRSLNLGKPFHTFAGAEKKRNRSGSGSSRKTFAGFEMRSVSPALFHRDDEAITRALLASRRPMSFAGTGKVPFGFGHANGASRSTPELVKTEVSPIASPSPSPVTPGFSSSPTEPTYYTNITSMRSPPPDYTIDFLSAQVLPHLVPSVVVGRSTIVDREDAPLNRRRSSVGTAMELALAQESDLSRSSRPTRNIRNLSLPNLLSSTSFTTREDTTKAVEPAKQAKTPESVISSIPAAVRGRVVAEEAKSLRRRSWKDRTAKAWDEVEEKENTTAVSSVSRRRPEPIEVADQDEDSSFLRPPPSARSLGWSLDLPESADETEVLEEEGNVADESEGDDDEEAQQAELEAHRRRRSVSPMSLPTSPVHDEWQHLDESIVFQGSQHHQEEEEDGEIGTVHCASIRPVYRSDASDVDSTSHYSLRPTHIPTGSLSSNRSLGNSSITSVGFRNTMATGSWHARDDSTGRLSSDDNSSANEGSAPNSRRSSTAFRPLGLLTQRTNIDRNSSASDSSDRERELRKVERHASARSSSRIAPNAHGVPLPPIPPTIEEADNEDKSSGAPTPRTIRQRTASTPRGPSVPPATSTPPPSQPTRTPPHITSRTRARRQHRSSSRDVGSSADENVHPVRASEAGTQPLRVGSRAGGGGTTSLRGLR